MAFRKACLILATAVSEMYFLHLKEMEEVNLENSIESPPIELPL